MNALGTTGTGEPLTLDLDRLIGGHACIVANAGGGKSGLIRRILETTHGRVQHIILDIEDEFYTLRERFDYVIAGGDGGDVPATLANAEGLALAALTHGFSLIVQLNDLGADAPEFVGQFLTAMIQAPRDLWHPALVVLDETQRFAPQGGSTAATAGVKALSAQGRKRGFTAIYASQRIAKIAADVRGDINNWMLGRVGQTIDRNTMADQLGFTAREAQDRFRGMPSRHFWAQGPAISDEPVMFTVADVETTPVKPGQAKVATPPPPEALRSILAGLSTVDAPVEAGSPRADDSDRAAMEAELRRLRAERDEWTIDQAHGQQQLDALIAENRALREIAARIGAASSDMARIRPALEDVPGDWAGGSSEREQGQTEGVRAAIASAVPPRATAPASAARTATEKAGGGNASPADLPPRRKRILDAIAWGCQHFRRASVDRDIVAWLADTSPRSSGYANDLGAMRTSGLIDYPSSGAVALTAAGLELAAMPPAITSRADLWAAIAAKLPPRQVKIVDALFSCDPLSRAELAGASGTSAASSGFANDLGRLRTLGLIDYPVAGQVGLGRVWQ